MVLLHQIVQVLARSNLDATKGIDDSGRPQVDASMEPSENGTLVWPSLYGATNWFSPSYSPATKLVYISVREQSSYFYKTEAEYQKGAMFTGGGERAVGGAPRLPGRFAP